LDHFLHLVNLVGVVHQVDSFDATALLGLSEVLHDERDIPNNDNSLFSASNCLRRVRDEDGLGEYFFGWDIGCIELEHSFSIFPEPKDNNGLASSSKFILIMIKFDKSL
jgi:hypothetical protein